MRKWLSLLLAVCLIAGLAAPAWADLYEEFGDVWGWTEEQGEAAEAWSEEQWQEYWQGYEEARLREYRLQMGCVYLTGPNLMLNGQFLDFGTDTPPQLVDGHLVVPVAGFFAYLATTVDDAGDTATVQLANGDTITLSAGQPELRYTRDGESYTDQLEQAPLLLNGVLYMTPQVVTQVFGYDYYDQAYYQNGYLVDHVSLIAQLDANFTRINQTLAHDWQVDARELMQGDFNLRLELGEIDMADPLVLELVMSYLAQDALMELQSFVYVDPGMLAENIFTAEDLAYLDLLDQASVELLFNLEANLLYLKSELLPLLEMGWDEQTWLQIPLDNILAYTDYQQYNSLGELIYDSAGRSYNSYALALEAADFLALLFGDENFVSSSQNGLTSHALNVEGLVEPREFDFAPEYIWDCAILITEDANGYQSLSLELGLTQDWFIPLTLQISLQIEDGCFELVYAITVTPEASLVFSLTGEPLTDDVVLREAPPTGETVIDLAELFG